MCQAYDAEYSAICSGERYATRRGFEAAAKGEPRENPYDKWDKYNQEAWEHGFSCFTASPPLLPWGVESELRGQHTYGDYGLQIADRFRQTGTLPREFLRNYSHMKYYRCKCGKSEAWGSQPPYRCSKCEHCGSDLAMAPDAHGEPVEHDFKATSVETNDGPAQLDRCTICGRTRKEATP